MKPFRFHVESVPFPKEIQGTVRGAVKKCKTGYLILMDKSLTKDQYKQTLKHELSHIILGHFEISETETTDNYLQNIKWIEAETDSYADQMTDNELADLMKYHIGDTIPI